MRSLAQGIAAALAGEWRDGRAYCDETERILRDSCTGALWELGTAHRFALWPLMFMGQVVEINRRLPRLLKEARERDDLYEQTNLSLGIRTFVCPAADEPQQARSELAQVMQKWSQEGFHVIAHRRGDTERSASVLKWAIDGLLTSKMPLHAAAARRRLGQMIGGMQGRELVQQAEEWMREQTIRNLDRMTALLAPGWEASY
jgi:hypothetical protein